MAYPNAGPGMYNSFLAQVAVYKLLVMNNIIIQYYTVYTYIYLLLQLEPLPAGNARDRSLVTVIELSVSSGEVHMVLAKSSNYVCKSCHEY